MGAFGGYLHLVDITNSGNRITLDTYTSFDVTSVVPSTMSPGSVRSYGLNTRRYIRGAGPKVRSILVRCDQISRYTTEVIEAWMPSEVCYRDAEGNVIFGVIESLVPAVDARLRRHAAELLFTVTQTRQTPAV